MAKLTGIPPLHGSHAAVPFACDGFFTLGLWLYGSIIITIGKSWRQLCQKLHTERWHESLACYPSFRVMACQPVGFFPIETYSIALFCFQGTTACQPVKAYRRRYALIEWQTSLFGKRGVYHHASTKGKMFYSSPISKDKILAISLVSILRRNVSSTTIC